ncbi:MAG: BON domain-containing protein [Deltaproteobacteria bacterium]|nr:BON domain-containing protein [Deltaproteobacteria bacterium]
MQGNDVMKIIKASLGKELCIDLVKHPVHIKMENNAILMEGVVERIAHKKRALLITMSIPGISGVIDRLRVRPAKEMGDKEIKNHIHDAFAEEPTLNNIPIEVEVNNGVVDIEGTVSSLSHKRLAGVLAWWVPGSTDVINSLEVVPPEEDSDDEITDAVMLALEKDKLVNHSSIKVTTQNYVVTLTGIAHSEPEKNAAEDDAWYIWGVNEVVNRLKVVR